MKESPGGPTSTSGHPGGPTVRRAGRLRLASEGIGHDLRTVLRQLRRSPGFTAVAVLTLALAISTNAAVFTLVDAYFLKPLPYEDPGRLVALWETGRDSPEANTVAPGNYRDWREQLEGAQAVGASNLTFPTLSGEGEIPERILGTVTSAELIELLGVDAMLGRRIRPDDTREGAEPVAVLAHGLWTRRYGGDPEIVGRTIRVSGRPTTVVGVMPPDFRHPGTFYRARNAQIWLPLVLGEDEADRHNRYLHVVARLAPGASVASLQAEMTGLADRLAEAWPETNRGRGAVVRPLDEELFGDLRGGLLMLLGAAAVVLLVACGNLATLMLVRGRRKAGELAVRAALGSGRARLLRQLAVEALVIGLLGGLAGVTVVLAASDFLSHVGARYLTAMGDVRVDMRVVGFTLVAAVGTSLLFGLLPALKASRPDLRHVLGEARSGGPRGARLRQGLVAAEVSLTLVLLVTGGLLVRSLLQMVRTPVGFQMENGLVFEAYPPPDRYPDMDAVGRYYATLTDRLESLPGVVAASAISDLPFTSENRGTAFRAPDRPLPGDEPRFAEFHTVTGGYFRTMGVPLLAGRTFQVSDNHDAPVAVVIGRSLAREIWGEEEAAGRVMEFQDGEDRTRATVVGVVGDILDDGLTSRHEPRLYFRLGQNSARGMGVVVRTAVPPTSLAGAVRDAAREVDDQVAVAELRTLEEHVMITADRPRGAAWLVTAFAALALLMAAVGLYGVLAAGVAERHREMGIRAALGAARGALVALVLRESLGMVAAGVVVGMAVALGAGKLLAGLLYQVSPWDPGVVTGSVLLLAAVAALAAWIPARRAAGADPVDAIREV